jgi:Mg-chelatase subunit ChlD
MDDGAQAQSSSKGPSASRQVNIGDSFQPKRLDTPLDKLTRQSAGKRSFTLTKRKRGRYIKAKPMRGRPDDLAFDATIRTAAPFQRRRADERASRKLAFVVKRQDMQKKVRVRRAANLVLFVVDASWSMAAAERIEATKGAVLSLLHDAYQRRDQVGLIVFQKEEARIVLPPTSSVELAQHALRNIPVGGKTPLSAGLLAAYRVCTAAQRRSPEIMPLIIILTDGAGNVSVTGMPPQEEAMRMAHMIHDSHFRTVVINMEHPAFDRGLAQQLADQIGGPCYTLPELKAEALLNTVRQELSQKPGEAANRSSSASDGEGRLPDVPGAFAAGNRP